MIRSMKPWAPMKATQVDLKDGGIYFLKDREYVRFIPEGVIVCRESQCAGEYDDLFLLLGDMVSRVRFKACTDYVHIIRR